MKTAHEWEERAWVWRKKHTWMQRAHWHEERAHEIPAFWLVSDDLGSGLRVNPRSNSNCENRLRIFWSIWKTQVWRPN